MHVGSYKQRGLVIALFVSLIMWNLPFGGFILYPLKLLATWLHELSHGVAMILTGAGFDHMQIYQDTSGLAFALGGTTREGSAVVASAGYMGTPLFGGAMLIVGQTPRGARAMLVLLAALLAIPATLYVSNDFGVAVGLVGACLFALASAFAGPRLLAFIVNFVAAQSCINAVLDIQILFRANLSVNGGMKPVASDAHNMARITGIGDATLWATIWLVWSVVLFYIALRLLYLRQQRAAHRAPPAPNTDGDHHTHAEPAQAVAGEPQQPAP